MAKKPKDKNIIVRSSNYNPNYLNSGKRDLIFNPGLFDTLAESCNDVMEWLRANNIDYNKYLDKDQLNIIDLPVRLKQVVGKQSTSILKSMDKKLEKID